MAKTKPQVSGDAKKTRIKALKSELNKGMRGKAIVMDVDEVPNVHMLRRPFGLPSLDIPIGGGCHASGIITLSGPPGTGKSLLCWHVAAEIQRNYGADAAILYATNEGVMAKDLARIAGCAAGCTKEEITEIVEIRKARDLRPLGKEEIAQLRQKVGVLQQASAESAESLLELVLRAVRSGLYQMVVIDSITNALPESVKDSDMGEGKVADRAGLVTQFVNKLTHMLLMETPDGTVNETTVIAVKQVRSNIGAMSMRKPTKESLVAHALDHNRLLGLEIGQSGDHFGQGAGWHKIREGKSLKWKVVKGKHGCHEGHTGTYDFHFDAGIDVVGDVAATGLRFNVITQPKKGRFQIMDESGNEIANFHGKDALRAGLASDRDLMLGVKEACFRAAECVFRIT